MSAKEVKFSVEARDRMLHGIDTLAHAVRVTLGPKGRNVLLDKSFGAPRMTKDGVTVAKEIELEDKFENMGAQMVRESPRRPPTRPGTARLRRRRGQERQRVCLQSRAGHVLEQFATDVAGRAAARRCIGRCSHSTVCGRCGRSPRPVRPRSE